ncbi:hypothetical protein AVEN_28581-1 [Araneus ventricosus]|uniref:STIM1/2 EF-hand domain-containing protein n=1 Tax=Araneus ventricosus TaxID=182803 RepID=A0A4Y2DDV5_ARAVE|nr:hypothetical protein AVEN_28581-1 [Araneus ventricosus]
MYRMQLMKEGLPVANLPRAAKAAATPLWFIPVSSEDSEASKEEFLIKSSKVIEAVPNVLRRVPSTATAMPDDWDCAAVFACDDPMGYEAIRSLHRQLDDDANGSIDVSETDEVRHISLSERYSLA